MKLIDCLPFFFDDVFGKKRFNEKGTWSCEVVKEHTTGAGWTGKQSHIIKWWELENGYAVGWQHYPSNNTFNDPYAGDAFYMTKMKK